MVDTEIGYVRFKDGREEPISLVYRIRTDVYFECKSGFYMFRPYEYHELAEEVHVSMDGFYKYDGHPDINGKWLVTEEIDHIVIKKRDNE